MKILWLTNIPLPEASFLMNECPSSFGGWLTNTSKYLSDQKNCELAVAFPKNNIENNQTLHGERINHYAFPKIKSKARVSIDSNRYLKDIVEKVNPDLVHIFGTEFEHSLAMINVCSERGNDTVISIQGLVSVIGKHYKSNLPFGVQKRFTFRDFIKQDSIQQQQKKFVERGMFEIEAIKRAKHVIGRTTWDKACTSQINPDATYHFCNEILREEFYNHEWKLDQCERFSIFTSQASYPIKGIHFVLEAMPLILKRFPQTKLYIAGHDITKVNTFKQKIKLSSYAKYVISLIKENNLESNVVFTGLLDEKKMCTRFLKTHVFVSSSTIENESNSLSEAKILGVPSIASYVGGVIDRVQHNFDGFHYQHDAPNLLAHYVCEIFENKDLAMRFSKNAREHALKTHDRDVNTRKLIEIYEEITGKRG